MKELQLELPLFEEWLPIEGYDGYEVSNFGRIKSLERMNSLGRIVKERILKPSTNKYGYQQVSLFKNGKRKWFRVHRLVANTFIDNPNNLPQVNHIDECKTNNHISNLEWCTAEYNVNFGTRNEKVSKALCGKNHPNSKQIIQLTLDNQVVRNWGSIMDVQRELGYHNAHICKCCENKRKSAYKYKWCYA